MNIDFEKLHNSDKLISLIEGRFTEDMKIEKIPPVLYIEREKEIISLGGRGNVTIFFGMPKSGKSIVLEMLAGAMLNADGVNGVVKRDKEASNCIYVDMEQGLNEWGAAMNRVMKYAGVKSIPPSFLSLLFTGEPVMDRLNYLEAILEATDKVDVVILDGLADIVETESDSSTTKKSSERIKSLAVRHNCLIVGILHTDKQARGPRDHIGSKYEKIGSTLIRVEKQEGANMFTLKPHMLRNESEWASISFYIDKDDKMVKFRSVKESKDFKGANFTNKEASTVADSVLNNLFGKDKINLIKNKRNEEDDNQGDSVWG